MRQNGNAARLECGGTEDGFLTGMREDCETDGPIRDALDRCDNFLAFAVGNSGIHDDDAARSDNEGDVGGASAIFRGDLAAASQQGVHARGDLDGGRRRGTHAMGSAQRGENADDQLAQEIFDGEASVHGDLSATADCS